MVTESSKKWLARQKKDRFVKMAREQGLRSRAVFKLREMQEKVDIIRKDMRVLELGAAPGSWTYELAEWVGPNGKIFAIDTLAMNPIPGVEIQQMDITSEEYQQWQELTLKSTKIDCVVSDIAPNTSGDRRTDQLRQEAIGEAICEIAEEVLSEDGAILMKTFHGHAFDSLLKRLRLSYKQVKVLKPAASQRSKHEVYLYASCPKTTPRSPLNE